MKNGYLLIALLMSFVSAQAQSVVLSEDFTTYVGSVASIPAGWDISWNSTSSSSGSYYTSGTSSGASGPNSYKFGQNDAMVTSAPFVSADSVKFWCKGNSTDQFSYLVVYQTTDGTNYTSLDTIRPIPTTGGGLNYSHAISLSATRVRVKFFKSAGNTAFDDFRIVRLPQINANFSVVNACGNVPVTFSNTTTSVNGNVSYSWNFGDGSPSSNAAEPNHTYANNGCYDVTLTATDGLGNSSTFTAQACMWPQPTSDFSFQNNGAVYVFTDQSSVSAGSITFRQWTFGDGGSSNQTNPAHAYTANGTYNVCLTVTAQGGCTDQHCTDVLVSGLGIEEVGARGPILANATDGRWLIFGNGMIEKVTLIVADLGGRNVLSSEVEVGKAAVLDITPVLQRGVYLVKMTVEGQVLSFRMAVY